MTRPPYFLLTIHPDGHPTIDFRGGNHVDVFYGWGWNNERGARHAIKLIDPAGQHPVVVRDRRGEEW